MLQSQTRKRNRQPIIGMRGFFVRYRSECITMHSLGQRIVSPSINPIAEESSYGPKAKSHRLDRYIYSDEQQRDRRRRHRHHLTGGRPSQTGINPNSEAARYRPLSRGFLPDRLVRGLGEGQDSALPSATGECASGLLASWPSPGQRAFMLQMGKAKCGLVTARTPGMTTSGQACPLFNSLLDLTGQQ